jgi:hypothetical protein
MHRLLGDAQQRGDLLPAPATLAGAAHLQLLDGLQQRPQGGDPASGSSLAVCVTTSAVSITSSRYLDGHVGVNFS